MAHKKDEHMKREEFEIAVQSYGTDFEFWPESLRSQGVAFAETAEGKDIMLAEQALIDALQGLPDPKTDPAFLERLIDIPRDVPQPRMGLGGLSQFFKDLFELPALGAPRALIAQGALAVFIFAGGIAAGQTGTVSLKQGTGETEEIDLVAYWDTSGFADYDEEQSS